jgi:hypothetical protein
LILGVRIVVIGPDASDLPASSTALADSPTLPYPFNQTPNPKTHTPTGKAKMAAGKGSSDVQKEEDRLQAIVLAGVCFFVE